MLVAYLTASVSPYLPYFEYQANLDYYAKVLCENQARPTLKCNGKCALAKKLEAVNQASPADAPPLPGKLQLKDFLPFHLFAQKKEPIISTARQGFPEQQHRASTGLTAPPTPPPES